jgi:hypothetical protein
MAIFEERLQILLPATLKKFLEETARKRGLSISGYVRGLIEADRQSAAEDRESRPFPLGATPIRTGRKRGSIEHDRARGGRQRPDP